MMKFSDGMQFDTSRATPRVERRRDGLYVVGAGMLIPVETYEEAEHVLAELSASLQKR